MVDQQQLDLLKQNVHAWNQWREKNRSNVRLNLSRVDLSRTNLSGADLSVANLSGANFSGADLSGSALSSSILSSADLSGADLRGAVLGFTDLYYTDFSGADLSKADFSFAILRETNLSGANFEEALLGRTFFGNVDLSVAKELETIKHRGPSTIGIDTIYRSLGNIPEIFLKGAGIDDTFITYIRSLVGKALEYSSCFISYSSKDEAFARRLDADLQSHNVRCWFAPEDLKIGEKFWQRIDESIRLYDKLLVVLSQNSIASTWVENEVMTALEKEQQQQRLVLFPIRLDEAVMQTQFPWAASLRRLRHIGDFTSWKEHDAYQEGFTRLLRDLKAEA